ncbi:hypothetical protein [Paenibacillus piri]|uniref:hypothetical protein n=1 Tax=Paenibacillus piri TaxID=2547395 RepID=UPI001404E59A|nr:hypothetical protein [Paenibacillus piri]
MKKADDFREQSNAAEPEQLNRLNDPFDQAPTDMISEAVGEMMDNIEEAFTDGQDEDSR